MSNIFHYYIHDKDGRIEMEMFKEFGKPFSVHFPRYESYPTRLRTFCQTFSEMRNYQVGMLIFAYNEEEFRKFEKAYEEWYKNHPRRKLIEEYMKPMEIKAPMLGNDENQDYFYLDEKGM